MARFMTVAGLLVALVLGGCGGSDDESSTSSNDDGRASEAPVEALERQMTYLTTGQHDRAYAEIHPAQQELFTQDQYSRCGAQDASSIDLEGIKLVESYETTMTVPGTDLEVDATALTVEVKISGMEPQTDTYRQVEVDGEWRFTVSDPDELIDC